MDLDFRNSKEASPKEISPSTECTQDVALRFEVSPVPKIPIFAFVYKNPRGPKPGEAQLPKNKLEIRTTNIKKLKTRFKEYP